MMKRVFEDIYKSLEDCYKAIRSPIFLNAMVSTMIGGMIIHLFMIVSFNVNHDSLKLTSNSLDWLIGQGKWAATAMASLEGPQVLNYISQVIGIAMVAIASGFMCEMYQIRSKAIARLVGVALIAFPSVATSMLYIAFDYFGLVCMLCVFGAFLMSCEHRFCKLVSVIILIFALGGYQAYISFTLALLVLDCIIRLTKTDECKKVLIRGFIYIFLSAVAVLGYYAVLKSKIGNNFDALSSYSGANKMNELFRIDVLLRSCMNAYIKIYDYVVNDSFSMYGPSLSYVNILSFLLIPVSFLYVSLKNKKKLTTAPTVVAVILIIVAFPLAVNAVSIFSQGGTFYYNSCYSFVLIDLAALMILGSSFESKQVLCEAEKLHTPASSRAVIFKKSMIIMTTVTLLWHTYGWIIYDNTLYQKVQYSNQHIYAKSIELVCGIERVEEYDNDIPVYLISNGPCDFFKSGGSANSYDRFNTNKSVFINAYGEIYSAAILRYYMTNFIGASTQITVPDAQTLDQYHEQIANMTVYPATGSIQYCDSGETPVILVKLSDMP